MDSDAWGTAMSNSPPGGILLGYVLVATVTFLFGALVWMAVCGVV